jgi:adenylate cyclase
MSLFTHRSFRVDIITAFAGLLLITFVTVLAYNYSNTSRIVLMLSDNIMDRTTDLVIKSTVEFLTPPARLTELTAKLVGSGLLSFKNLPRLERYLAASLRALPQASMFYLGDQQGNFLLARREDDAKIATKYMHRLGQQTITTWKVWDDHHRLLASHTLTTDLFDHRTRPWYKTAAQTKQLSWSDLYIFYTGHEPGLTVSFPIIDGRGKVLGVVGCDLAVVQLSHFLRRLVIGETGLAFIMNEKKEVVAYPDPDQIVGRHPEAAGNFPIPVQSLQNQAVVLAFQNYQENGVDEFSFVVGGRRYLASFTKFPASFGSLWKVGVIVPEDDFTGAVSHLMHQVLIICSGFFCLALGVAVLLARLISKPVLRLAAETDRIRHLHVDEPLQLHSHITEIQVLTRAVERMKGTLRSFMRFAPRQLVQEVVLGDKELLLGGERREVTLLFSDLRSFTQFAEQNRPEDVVHVLNLHFDAMIRVIAAHQGYVVDFLGDSLFVAFGALHHDPDHATHAVTCALAMQVAQAQLNDQWADRSLPPLEMGIGINSGSCVVGNMGSHERIKYDVVGHAVNVAARIETFTVGGQVLIAAATRQLLQEGFILSEPLSAYGKGVEGPLKIYEVRGHHDRPDLTLPPVVSELQTLQPPMAVFLRLISGKQIATDLHPATLTQISRAGAALTTETPLDCFAPLQLAFPDPTGENLYLDGKVVSYGQERQSYIIKFSPLSPAAQAKIEQVLARHT